MGACLQVITRILASVLSVQEMKLFNKKKVVTQSEAIAQLRGTADMVEKREKYLQFKVDNEVQDAKNHLLAGRKKSNIIVVEVIW